ncbi:MAG TPA: rod shape-determining protein MreD [Allosphingosinicella sp.]|nr:rod shape-determining protein MreD [Allosphingosinicella sp.]
MSRIALTPGDVRLKTLRREYVPIVSTIIACSLVLLPIVVSSPIVPDFAFLVVIAWRLLRPEMWTAKIALPLGFYNDLVAGHPIGQSMALWTMTFLAFDLLESRLGFRDYLMDWLLAAGAIIFHTFGVWYIALLMGSDARFTIMIPQIGLSVLAYPVAARLVLARDRWRLAR